MTGRRPTPAQDQADAATRDANLILTAAAVRTGQSPLRQEITGPLLTVIDQFRNLATRPPGLVGCPHLRHPWLGPVHWVPWTPATIRCAPCHAHALQQAKGTHEDNVCDGCRRTVPLLRPVTVVIPAVVNDRHVSGRVVVTPPVVVLAGLCEACECTSWAHS